MAQVPFTIQSIARYTQPAHRLADAKVSLEKCEACRFEELIKAGCHLLSAAELVALRSPHYAYLA